MTALSVAYIAFAVNYEQSMYIFLISVFFAGLAANVSSSIWAVPPRLFVELGQAGCLVSPLIGLSLTASFFRLGTLISADPIGDIDGFLVLHHGYASFTLLAVGSVALTALQLAFYRISNQRFCSLPA
jgi:hypothetical protein